MKFSGIRALFDLYTLTTTKAGIDYDAVRQALAKIRREVNSAAAPFESELYPLYARLISLRVSLPSDLLRLAAEAPDETSPVGSELGGIASTALPGISLVTCSKNRSENLIKALSSWLAHDEIDEIVIVDWGSDVPVEGSLVAAGISDPRIVIVRVEDEPRWILSYAFNVGFRVARYDTVLKADADIILSQDFFEHNRVDDTCYIAGNWRLVEEEQAHVNGFFLAPLRALHDVNGFNEFIQTYGWDDDDLYTRLVKAGFRRKDVAPNTIHHLDHDDAARLDTEGDASSDTDISMLDQLCAGPKFLIHSNRVLTALMPEWSPKQPLQPFTVASDSGSRLSLKRSGWIPSELPVHVQHTARFQALNDLLSWRFGRRVRHLDQTQLMSVLSRPARSMSVLDVEVALAAPNAGRDRGEPYLVLDLDSAVSWTHPALGSAFTTLKELASRQGLYPVLRANLAALPDIAPVALHDLPLVASWHEIGSPSPTSLDALRGTSDWAEHTCLAVDHALLDRLATAAPAIASRRSKIFIDAQHGLGNRLRAIGSAAAVAKATDRELVIVWEPDHHCEGHFTDLFDYEGAIISEAFVNDARANGMSTYNYMEIESQAAKNAPIIVESGRDIYARSAYVLNTDLSTWKTENQFLQGLIPVSAIRDLVAGVRNPNDVSVHVRMVGGSEYENLSYEALDNWTEEGHAETEFWRKKSHFSHFIARLDTLIAEGRADHVFLAADKPETYDAFTQTFGDRVADLPRQIYDRSAEQLQYALADAILLSRAPLLLGSTWSSFSELAMRLSPGGMKIEMSGKDF